MQLPFWPSEFLLKNQLIAFWEFPCIVFIFPCCFSYSVFNFCHFDYSVSWCVFPWVYPAWDSLCFLDLVDSHIREVFNYYLFKYFLRPFLSLSSFWDPYNVNFGALNVVQRSLRLSSFPFILFSVFCSAAVISTILSSRSFTCASVPVILLCLFFSSCRSLSSVQSLSRILLSATPWTAARQASLSITNSWTPPKTCPL